MVRRVLLMLLLMASVAQAGGGRDPLRITTSDKVIHFGGTPSVAKTDTILVFGGPGTTEGKFEDAYGFVPDRQGWTGHDDSVSGVNHWHVSDYRAGDLDPGLIGNLAWWCGEDLISCSPSDPEGGYGNLYDDQLTWSGAVGNSATPVTVRVTAWLNHDLEPGYDALELAYHGAIDWVTVWSGDGAVDHLAFGQNFVVTPADYQNGGDVQLRWRVRSDGAWSDADCLYQSGGAAQIDRITVEFDQGAGFVIQAVETCEPGDPLLWEPVTPQGVGDFSQVWPDLYETDLCHSNWTPQFAFIDDGIVVPGTGGSMCITYCYGPNGFVVNSTGGLVGDTEFLDNSIQSPPIDLPGGDYTGHLLSFEVWPHMPIATGMFWFWEVRYSTEATGDAWSGWQDRSWVYYGDAGYSRREYIISDLAPAGAVRLQISFGVKELGWLWGIETHDVTPAPYFDNVSYRVFRQDGPMLTSRAIDLPLDGFAPLLDPADPAAASVRFDAGRLHTGGVTPGDSITVDVTPMRPGAELTGPPEMHYRLTRNAIFDPWRSAGLPDVGAVIGDSVQTYDGVTLLGRWSFDLPDAGFLFPGDALRIHFSASTDLAGDVRTSLLPADTTGFASSPTAPMFDGAPYPEDFTFRALPTVHDVTTMAHPPLLLWADAVDEATNDRWFETLAHVLAAPGVYYDLYVVGDDDQSGLGLRTTSAALAGYDVLAYSGGDRFENLLTDSRNGTAQEDAQLLSDWLALGDKGLMVFGDNVVSDLARQPAPAGVFAALELGADLFDGEIRPLIDNQSAPAVRTLTSPPFTAAEGWIVYGGCPKLDTFDALTPNGVAVAAAEWLDPAGQGGAYAYAAIIYQPDPSGRGRVMVPWDLEDFYEDGIHWYQRSVMMMDLMSHFGIMPPTDVDDGQAPRPIELFVGNHPNPFNPATTVTFAVPREGLVTIEIFDARGERVRTLLDEVRSAGIDQLTWFGRDDDGREVSTGLYFARIRADADTAFRKMLLLR